jgi:hypothetical protein
VGTIDLMYLPPGSLDGKPSPEPGK